MAFVPKKENFDKLDQDLSSQQNGNQNSFIPTSNDFSDADKKLLEEQLANQVLPPSLNNSPSSANQYSTSHNLGAGLANPWIAVTNFLAKHLPQGQMNYTLGASIPSPEQSKMQIASMTHPQAPFSPQPQMAADVRSAPYILGSILGTAPVFGAGSEALEGLGELSGLSSALKSAPSAVQRGAQIAKSGAAGAGTGFATTPGTSSDRTLGAIEQGIGGGAGETLGQGIGAIGRSLKGVGTPGRIITAMKEKLQPRDNAAENLINDIGRQYAKAKNEVKPAYKAVFSGKQKMMENDFPNYTYEINEDTRNNRAVPQAVKTPERLMRDHDNMKSEYIDPEEVHYLKSKLSGLGKGGNDNEIKLAYNRYADALKKDFKNYLSKTGKLDAYKKANKTFIKKLLPFRKSKAFTKKIEDALDYATVPELNGSHKLVLENVDPTLQSTKAVRPFLPEPNEEDLGKINELENLLGGDRPLTNYHIKNNTLAQSREGDNVSLTKLVNRYNRYSAQQKNRLFSKEEQDKMKALTKSIKIKSGGFRQLGRLLRGTVLGASLGHALSPKAGAEIGAIVGAPIAESGLQAAGKAATSGQTLSQLIENLLNPASISQTGSRYPAIAGSQLLNSLLNTRGTP